MIYVPILPAQHAYVVEWSAYEESGSLVVSTTTGTTIELNSLPQFSPSGRWFASIDENPMDETQYAFAIWSTAPDAPREAFRYSLPRNAPYEHWQFRGWDGDEKIRLKVDVSSGNGDMREMETSAVRTEKGWKLNWPLPSTK